MQYDDDDNDNDNEFDKIMTSSYLESFQFWPLE